jgi:hypothetical protein
MLPARLAWAQRHKIILWVGQQGVKMLYDLSLIVHLERLDVTVERIAHISDPLNRSIGKSLPVAPLAKATTGLRLHQGPCPGWKR